jgi:succinoglycan biosynthesis protein ExoV
LQLYYWNWRRNFGDELTEFLITQLAPGLIDDDPSTLFLGIGTILDSRVPREPKKVVFSSGFGYSDPPILDGRWKFYCVRGPLTAKALGLPAETAASDAGILVGDFFHRSSQPADELGFVPHWSSVSRNMSQVLRDEGIRLIDPMRGPEEVIEDIRNVGTVMTESLHGAIVADALRIPWIPVTLSKGVLDFKWRDWCATIGVEYEPVSFVAALPKGRLGGLRTHSFAWQLRRLRRNLRPVLSQEGVIPSLREDLLNRLHRLEDEYS